MLLAGLWLGPLPDMARRAFSPHMILHLGVMVAAAPLIALGLLRLLERQQPDLSLLGAISASGLEFIVVWGWHAPALHEAAARSSAAFALQQISFLVAGIGIWTICLARRTRRDFATGALAMFFTSMHMTMLGVLLVLAPSLLYAPEFCLGAFGLDSLADQQLGGGLMALFGGGAYAIGGAWLAARLAA